MLMNAVPKGRAGTGSGGSRLQGGDHFGRPWLTPGCDQLRRRQASQQIFTSLQFFAQRLRQMPGSEDSALRHQMIANSIIASPAMPTPQTRLRT